MKICFIVASMVGGGTERVISILANYWADNGHEVTILLTADKIVDYQLNSSIQVVSIAEKTNRKFCGRIRRIQNLRKFFLNNRETVFYSFGTETNLFAIIGSLFTRVEIIASERSDPNQCEFKLLRNIVYSLGYKFVFQTEQAKECFPSWIQKKGVVISNPIREDIPDVFDGERKKEVVAVGRLVPLKNHRLLIEAFADFTKVYSDYILKIYGQGELKKELQELSFELGIANKVFFMGFTEEVLHEIRCASIYVITSDYEGVSNSLLEAMALGLPVIATDCPIGGAASLIKPDINGILIPVRDKKALMNAMIRIARDSQLMNFLSVNARKVRKTNEIKKICDQWIRI